VNLPRKIRLLYEPFEYDDKGRKRLGAWSQAYSGERYWVMDPMEEEIHLIDIVEGLANASRYRGQTQKYYSVLSHSVLVSIAVEKLAINRGWSLPQAINASMEGLFHDGSEAYLGDVARPLKRMKIMRGYCKIEKLWQECINSKFGIRSSEASRKLVEECDRRIVIDEVYSLMRDPDMWPRGGRYLDLAPLNVEIKELPRSAFYDRYNYLLKWKSGKEAETETTTGSTGNVIKKRYVNVI